jgi:ABC-type nitrate/sulfonate/bicarbonate transport system ATPase subunit
VKPLLEIEGLSLMYPGTKSPVLEDFSLRMEAGELLCILGPSGCGKSTLLKGVAGLMPPAGGSFRYHPRRTTGKQAPYDRILVLQRDDQLFPWLTVLQNVSLPLRRIATPLWRERCGEILGRLGIPESAELYPHQLSGGMRQRAVLARALAADPELLLLDEPFAHLDAAVRQSLQELVVEIWLQGGRSMIFVTHDIQEALVLAGRIVVMSREGKVLADRRIELPRPRDPYDPLIASLVRDFRVLLD